MEILLRVRSKDMESMSMELDSSTKESTNKATKMGGGSFQISMGRSVTRESSKMAYLMVMEQLFQTIRLRIRLNSTKESQNKTMWCWQARQQFPKQMSSNESY